MFSRALRYKSGPSMRCPAQLLSGPIAALATLASSSVAGFAQGVPLPALGAKLSRYLGLGPVLRRLHGEPVPCRAFP